MDWVKGSSMLVSCFVAAECLDLLRLFVVKLCKLISCFAVRPQQFVQLRVNGLSVAVFGSLDEERHQQRGNCRNPVPSEPTRVENEPEHDIEKHHANDPRT